MAHPANLPEQVDPIERTKFFERKSVDWYSSDERHEVIRLLVKQRPNLLQICQPYEIDLLLYDCVKKPFDLQRFRDVNRLFIDYVVASGYTDEPLILNNDDRSGPRLLPQVTALQRVAESRYSDPCSRRYLDDVARQLFRVFDRFDVNCIDIKTGWTHLQAACVFGLVDQVQKFLDHGHDPNCRWRETGDTPLHVAARPAGNKSMIELLLRRGAKPTLKNKERLTPLDILVRANCTDDVELVSMMLEAGRDEFEADKVHEWLHWTVWKRLPNMTKLLLKNGADPTFDLNSRPTNYVRRKDRSTLFRMFNQFDDDYLLAALSTMLGQGLLKIDARDESRLGKHDTLLHMTLASSPYLSPERLSCNTKTASMLLRLGANPNTVNDEARTTLHVICARDADGNLTKWFFDMVDEIGLEVDIDARDKHGLTALHLAVQLGRCLKSVELLLERGADPNATCSRDALQTLLPRSLVRREHRDTSSWSPLQCALSLGCKEITELLLNNGVDPNLANAEGLTPLLVICKTGYPYDGLLEQFLKICDDLGRPARLDVTDNEGRTPLQWAVSTVLPSTIDVLLDRGADLASFVFPTEDYFGAWFDTAIGYTFTLHLQIVLNTLRTIERLENRGYELKRSDALTIMKFFKKHNFFVESSADLKNQYYNDKEVEKIIVYRDDGRFVPTRLLYKVPVEYRWVCYKHRCEKLARKFFRAWAIKCLMEMTRSRPPLECCEKIIDHGSLVNTDLCNICLATPYIMTMQHKVV